MKFPNNAVFGGLSRTPTCDNFPYKKYNCLVMQKGFRKEIQNAKGECIYYEKAD